MCCLNDLNYFKYYYISLRLGSQYFTIREKKVAKIFFIQFIIIVSVTITIIKSIEKYTIFTNI